MKRILLVSLSLLFFFELNAQTYKDKKAKKVVEAYLEAVGGKGNWDAVWSRTDTAQYSGLEHMSKKVSETNCFIEKNELSVSIYQEGMYYRETHHDEGVSFSRHNGLEYSMQTQHGSLITLPPDQSNFMKEGLSLVRGYPHRIMESKSINSLGKKKINGFSYNTILVNYHLIGGTIFYFDIDTHLLIYSHLKGHKNKLTEYQDYRSVNNLLIPFETTTEDNGVLISKTKVQSITLNQPVDNSIFD